MCFTTDGGSLNILDINPSILDSTFTTKPNSICPEKKIIQLLFFRWINYNIWRMLYKILIHLIKQFQRRRFFNVSPNQNKNCPWPPCFLWDPDKLKELYKGLSIDAPQHILIHLAKWFQRNRFFNVSANQKQESSMVALFLSKQDEMRKLC